MRKFYVKQSVEGFLDGMVKGMSSSVNAFETPRMELNRDDFSGPRADRDAIAADVRRAEAKFRKGARYKREYTTAS